jgi:hypothetical protein
MWYTAIMRTKPNRQIRAASFQTRDETASDADTERFLADHHDAIEAKLQKARASIARGKTKPLEPLPVLLREARRRGKAAR